MESEPGVALGNFYQHQFFPGGCDPLQQNHANLSLDPPEAKWDKYGRYLDSSAERNDWDVKAWNWDSLLFLAQPSGSQRLSSGVDQGAGQDIHSAGVKRALGLSANSSMQENSPPPDGTKSLMVDDGSPEDDAECLTLKLGGHTYSSVEDTARNGKRQRSSSPGCQQYPMCQVDDCKADLSTAKDYHRRHKVCETHSKAGKALVGRLMQRFCQQCSRFHPLQEFDEGKRSCRRRLAGHNRRRRKTQPDAAAAQAYLLAEEDLAGKSAGILRLLQLLSQLQASTMEKVTAVQQRELALEYLRRAASVSSALGDFTSPKVEGNGYRTSGNVQRPEMKFNEQPVNGYLSPDAQLLSALSGTPLMETFSMLLQSSLKGQLPAAKETSEQLMSHMLQNGRTATSLNRDVPREHAFSLPSAIARNRSPVIPPVTTQDQSVIEVIPDENQCSPTVHKLFPLQSVAGSSGAAATGRDAGAESGDMGRPSLLALLGAGDKPIPSSPVVASASNLQSVQSQQSSESQSGSDQSPESSYAADLQERTGRISFKLFDRNPGDFPQLLRSQILEWLSHVPSDMESYIRPGCVLLAIFLSMPGSAWKTLCDDLLGSLKRLVDASSTDFWNKGRILVQVCDQTAYIVDGEVLAVSLRPRNLPHILGITPLAMVTGQKTKFVVKGFDLARPDTRIFCAYQGNYSPQPWTEDEVQVEEERLSFTHGPCDVIGRCFIEVECDGGSSFVPVIVADDAVCKELCSLEDEIETASSRAAMVAERYAFPEEDRWEFIHSVQVAVKHESARFLHDLGWLFQKKCWQLKGRQYPDGIQHSGAMKTLLVFAVEREWCAVLRTLLDILFSLKRGQTEAVSKVLEDANLLHRAVRSNSLAMVELLLSYREGGSYVFSPDVVGPSGLTPLHVAACLRGSEGVIGALTSDPAQVGLQAWDSARDSFGQTPFDCAVACGHLTYIQMVWSAKGKSAQVVVDIPSKPLENIKAQQPGCALELPVWAPSAAAAPGKLSSECCKVEHSRRRERQMAGIRGPMYKPFMLSMVAIAAVCVCVCLLLKGPPQVRFVLEPFTWESVRFGPK